MCTRAKSSQDTLMPYVIIVFDTKARHGVVSDLRFSALIAVGANNAGLRQSHCIICGIARHACGDDCSPTLAASPRRLHGLISRSQRQELLGIHLLHLLRSNIASLPGLLQTA
eukprot:5589904-Amphidinium_carterae.1